MESNLHLSSADSATDLCDSEDLIVSLFTKEDDDGDDDKDDDGDNDDDAGDGGDSGGDGDRASVSLGAVSSRTDAND